MKTDLQVKVYNTKCTKNRQLRVHTYVYIATYTKTNTQLLKQKIKKIHKK